MKNDVNRRKLFVNKRTNSLLIIGFIESSSLFVFIDLFCIYVKCKNMLFYLVLALDPLVHAYEPETEPL